MTTPSTVWSDPEAVPVVQASRRGKVWSALHQNALVLIGTTVICLFVLFGLAGLLIVHLPPLQGLYSNQDLMHALAPPFSPGHVLGTDNLGRDTALQLLAGLGTSLLAGVAVTVLALVFGLVFGMVAGYFPGWADALIGGVVDVTLGFPVILLAVVLAGAVGAGLLPVVVSVGVVNWAGFARIIRGQTLSLRAREFVEASRALGLPTWRILLGHVAPHLLPPTLVMATYYMAVAIMVEAGLSFLGLGVQPPTPSLGQMIAVGRDYLYVSPWYAIIPCIALTLIVLGFTTLGDGLRDMCDPRLGRQ
jgi:ABC-type dipeptide/oligopeptide/nickel transport system permease subunit